MRRVEALALIWELLSALLFGSAVAPEVLLSPWPALVFGAGLLLTASLAPALREHYGALGSASVLALRIVAWSVACAPPVARTGRTSVLIAGVFGIMAGAVRVALYQAYPRGSSLRRESRRTGMGLAARLIMSATASGVVGGHILMLFAVAFLRTTSGQLHLAWFTVLPWLALVPTVLFAVAVHLRTPRVLAGLRPDAPADLVDLALQRARHLPAQLAWLNFLMWVACGVLGAFTMHARLGFTPPAAVGVAAASVLFAWGLSAHQLVWQRAILSPVTERLQRGRLRAVGAATLRRRLLTDFGLPLLFLATLFLLAALGSYATLSRERGAPLAATDALALVASCAALTLATAAILLRSARELTRPIEQLVRATARVAAGDLAASLPLLDAPREVAALGQAVEAMRLTLAQTINELERERTGLEARVALRTAELQRALDELRQTQSALLHGEKMAMLGQLVAGVAHEINNPLTAIAGAAAPLTSLVADVRRLVEAYEVALQDVSAPRRAHFEQVRREVKLAETLQDLADIAELIPRSAKRGARIVDGLRKFSRSASEAGPTSLEEGLEETLALLGPALRDAGVEVTKHFEPLPPVVCCAGEVNQVFMNLLGNALAAVAGCEQRQIAVQTVSEGGWAAVIVEDSGSGVPEAHRQRIFEPFFTTKPAGQGTGLGLAISAQIAKHHRGLLTVERAHRGGARFVLRLPLDMPTASASVFPTTAPEHAS